MTVLRSFAELERLQAPKPETPRKLPRHRGAEALIAAMTGVRAKPADTYPARAALAAARACRLPMAEAFDRLRRAGRDDLAALLWRGIAALALERLEDPLAEIVANASA